MKFGVHVSIKGSVDRAVERAVEKGCNTLQMFSRNPRGWRSRKLNTCEIKRFQEKLVTSKIAPVFIHTPYLLNLASPKVLVYNKSVKALKEEVARACSLGVPYVVTHLGSHLGEGKNEGYQNVIDAINAVLSWIESDVAILIENTAGMRNSVGSSFEEIEYIVSKIEDKRRIGVCFDTCHAFAAGYDLATREAVEKTLTRFHEIIGLSKLKLVHLNDSKSDLGSRRDRHEHIGLGRIGEAGFHNILTSRLRELPFILETPIDKRRSDLENLLKVKELAQL